MRLRRCFCFALLVLVVIIAFACGKKQPEDLIVGPWRMEGGDTVYTFRKNQGWISLKTKEGEADAEKGAEDEKVEGTWAIERPEDDRKTYVIITPSETVDETPWKKGQPVRFELVDLTLKELVLKRENGDVEKWLKVGKHTEGEQAVVPGLVNLPLDPVVANLRRDRENEPPRYLCMNINLTLKNGEGLEYVKHVVDPESKKESYHIHPRINDVTLLFLSSLSYNDVKTLDKVRLVLGQFKKALEPYFGGKLLYINLTRVVVTPKVQTAMDFKKNLPSEEGEAKDGAPDHGEKKPEDKGQGAGEGHGTGDEKPDDEGHGDETKQEGPESGKDSAGADASHGETKQAH